MTLAQKGREEVGKTEHQCQTELSQEHELKSEYFLSPPLGFCSRTAGFPHQRQWVRIAFRKLHAAICFLISAFEGFISSGELISTPIIILGFVLMVSSFSRK